MGWFSTHAQGTADPPEVRNWYIHWIALVASMSALASEFLSISPCFVSLSFGGCGCKLPSYVFRVMG
jgi:hypothetical protein